MLNKYQQKFHFKRKFYLNSDYNRIELYYFSLCKDNIIRYFYKKIIFHSLPGYFFIKKNIVFFYKKITFNRFFIKKLALQLIKKCTKTMGVNPYFFYKFEEYTRVNLYYFKKTFKYKINSPFFLTMMKKLNNSILIQKKKCGFFEKYIKITLVSIFEKKNFLCFFFSFFLMFFSKKKSPVIEISWNFFFIFFFTKIFFFVFLYKKVYLFSKQKCFATILEKKSNSIRLIFFTLWNGILRASYFFSV